MSQENLDGLRAFYQRWAVGDWTDTSIFDPHAVGVFPDLSPRAFHGLEDLGAYWRDFLESWEEIRMEATEYREAENTFVVWVRRIARGKGSGVEVEDRAIHVWTFRGSKAIRLDVFEHESEALAAAGLAE
jgi:ketosteroid isomerase-like protein